MSNKKKTRRKQENFWWNISLNILSYHHIICKQMRWLIDWFCTPFHLNGIGFFSLVTHKRKTSKVTNPLLPRSTCALSLHLQQYHLEASRGSALPRIFKHFYSVSHFSQVKSNYSWNQKDAPVLFLTK